MKKILASIVMMAFFALMLPLSAEAHPGCRIHRKRTSYSRSYARRAAYQPTYATTYKRPSFYRRHRNLINVGIGAGAGTLIGALVGGKRGALVGGLVGAGSGAVYTYGIRPKKRRYVRTY